VPVSSKVASSVAVSASASITTQTLSPSSAAAVLLGSQTISFNSASDIVVGSHTISAGSAITVSGQQISLGSSGAIIINGASQTSSNPTPASTSPIVIVVGSTTLTGNPSSGFRIGTQTLFPGSAITVGSGVISLPSITPAPVTKTSINTNPILILGSITYTEDASSDFIIASQTLAPGSAITVSGEVISLSPTGNEVIVNAVPKLITSTTGLAPQSAITSLVIAGETLTAGGRVTVGGDVLSLAPSGTGIVVIGTVTVGGGESTVTATADAKKKNSGSRAGASSWVVRIQFCCVLILGFGLH
jgi:hypothetical protein